MYPIILCPCRKQLLSKKLSIPSRYSCTHAHTNTFASHIFMHVAVTIQRGVNPFKIYMCTHASHMFMQVAVTIQELSIPLRHTCACACTHAHTLTPRLHTAWQQSGFPSRYVTSCLECLACVHACMHVHVIHTDACIYPFPHAHDIHRLSQDVHLTAVEWNAFQVCNVVFTARTHTTKCTHMHAHCIVARTRPCIDTPNSTCTHTVSQQPTLKLYHGFIHCDVTMRWVDFHTLCGEVISHWSDLPKTSMALFSTWNQHVIVNKMDVSGHFTELIWRYTICHWSVPEAGILRPIIIQGWNMIDSHQDVEPKKPIYQDASLIIILHMHYPASLCHTLGLERSTSQRYLTGTVDCKMVVQLYQLIGVGISSGWPDTSVQLCKQYNSSHAMYSGHAQVCKIACKIQIFESAICQDAKSLFRRFALKSGMASSCTWFEVLLFAQTLQNASLVLLTHFMTTSLGPMSQCTQWAMGKADTFQYT